MRILLGVPGKKQKNPAIVIIKFNKMAKAQKLTKEELEVLNTIIKQLNSVQSQIGGLELQKHELLHTFAQVKVKLDEQQKELQEKYGDKIIDVNTGNLSEPSKED